MPEPGVEGQTIIKQKLVGKSAPQRHPGIGTLGQQCGQSMVCVRGEGQGWWHLEPEREAEAGLWRTLSTMQGS